MNAHDRIRAQEQAQRFANAERERKAREREQRVRELDAAVAILLDRMERLTAAPLRFVGAIARRIGL